MWEVVVGREIVIENPVRRSNTITESYTKRGKREEINKEIT